MSTFAEKAAVARAREAAQGETALKQLGARIRKDDEGNIVSLNLNSTKITDAGLAHLKVFAKLQDLSLSYTNITDAGLQHLKTLSNLGTLILLETDVTEAGVAELENALPNCEIIH